MLKYSDYEVLIMLHQMQSITATARKLYISQPALTKRIQKMEESLNVAIIKRNTKGIVFTEAGEHLVRYAQAVLQGYKNMCLDLRSYHESREKTVSIFSAGSLTTHLLPKLLSAFKLQYPEARFDLRYGGSNHTAQMICEGAYDVGFIRGEPWLDCIKETIRTEYACVISKEEIDLKDLPFLPRIDSEMSESAKIFISSWWNQAYDAVPFVSMIVPNILTCARMVGEGLGYSIIVSAEEYENMEGIHVRRLVDKHGDFVARSDYMISRKNGTYNQMTLRFIEFAKLYFSKSQEPKG